jgi:hypothetical protein
VAIEILLPGLTCYSGKEGGGKAYLLGSLEKLHCDARNIHFGLRKRGRFVYSGSVGPLDIIMVISPMKGTAPG